MIHTNFLDGEIQVFDSVFSDKEVDMIIADVHNKNYKTGERDRPGLPPAGLVCNLDGSITEAFLKGFLDKHFKDRFIATRSYCNLFAPNEYSYFHHDESDYTLMYYATWEWDVDHGGETKFIINTRFSNMKDITISDASKEVPIMYSVPPIPNRIILFKGHIPHTASPLRNNQRFTAVLKLKESK